MPSLQEHRQAFDVLAEQLRHILQLSARALPKHQGTPTGDVLGQQLEHTLQRIALLYRRGTYENLTVAAIFSAAIHQEALLAYEYQRELQLVMDSSEEQRKRLAAAADRYISRARALANAVRRARNVNISVALPFVMPQRGVYITPFSPEVRAILLRARDRFVFWQDGAVATVREDRIAALQQAGAAVVILYRSADELYDDAHALEPAALEAEFSRRLAGVYPTGDLMISDTFEHHVNRLLLRQSTILRNLQDRLQVEHPAAHRACQPLADENRRLLTAALQAYPSWMPANVSDEGDEVAQLIALERAAQAHAAAWAAHGEQDDHAKLLFTFKQFVAAGTLLGRLEQLCES